MSSDFELILGLVSKVAKEREAACDMLLEKYANRVEGFISNFAPATSPSERRSITDAALRTVARMAAEGLLDDCEDLRPVLIRCAKRELVTVVGQTNAIAASVAVVGTRTGTVWSQLASKDRIRDVRTRIRDEIGLRSPLERAIVRILNKYHPRPVPDHDLLKEIRDEGKLIPSMLDVIEARKALTTRVATLLREAIDQS